MNKNYTVIKLLSLLFVLVTICACKNKPTSSELEQLGKDLEIVADSISGLMSKYHYNPKELVSDEYVELEEKVKRLTKKSQTKENFVNGYNTLWAEGPFSHVQLAKMETPAYEMAQYIDSLKVGDQSVSLDWMNNTAILTVNTMTGIDTKEKVFDAYKEIAKNKANALIIDIRNNTGGTFAGIPLMAHLVKDSIDIGMFVSQKWWHKNAKAPTVKDIGELTPWEGWSIKSFWHDVQENPLTRIRIMPMNPHFSGPVYVLISNKTASAAEFAVDALAYQENVTIIGETTAGEMLSQKMFDLPNGLQLSLPIADYYSTRIGRIEGKGVDPDIVIDQMAAKDIAIALVNGVKLEDALAKVKKELSKKELQPLDGETLYLFGNMNNWGKKWSITPKFNYVGNGIYTTVTTFNKGSYEFKIAPMSWDFDFGANPNEEKVSIGQKIKLVKVPGSDNLRIDIDNESELIFNLDVSNVNAATLELLKK